MAALQARAAEEKKAQRKTAQASEQKAQASERTAQAQRWPPGALPKFPI